MSVLAWDNVGDRVYETGLDRGVLYLDDGSAVPWNGLTSIIEKFDRDTAPVYYDGAKISDLISVGDFAATMKAITYPDEFIDLEGHSHLRQGMIVGEQIPHSFNLSYRTQIGNDLAGDVVGYKIHILYNVTAIPSDITYSSAGSDPSLVEFEWSISAVPEEIPGFRPTAHVVFNTIELDPDLLEYIEGRLYGTEHSDAEFFSMADLISYMYTWARIEIIDNGNGTWTANCLFPEDLGLDPVEQLFVLSNANAIYLDADTYSLSNTINLSDVS